MKITATEIESRRPFAQWRFLQLLLAVLFWMIFYPRIERPWLGHLFLQLVMLDLLLVTIWANPHWVRTRKVVTGLLILSVVASIMNSMDFPQEWHRVIATVKGVLHLPILAACAVGVLAFVFRAERPTPDGIFATVVVYLLVAMMFAQGYAIALTWNPDSLHLTLRLDQLTPQGLGGELLYFSIVTLSTVGYGDILPTSEVTRMLSAIEAIVGQFYVAVIVAVSVATYVAHAQEEFRLRRAKTHHDD